MIDFNRVINRRGSQAAKWDMAEKLSGITSGDVIPMWVADMDFAAPPGVTAALRADIDRATHGYYGDPASGWANALKDWLARRHNHKIEAGWVSQVPGIVPGLGLFLQALTAPGDEIMFFTPGYHVFPKIILLNERTPVGSQLLLRDGRYGMDLADLKSKLTARTKAVFFCSPHNPGGTVWTRDEVRALAMFCVENNLLLVSDEIHCDLTFPGHRHTPTLEAAPEIADSLVSAFAATKTFNLAGAHAGALVTSNAELKKRLDGRISATGLDSYNSFGMIATEAAWRTGEAWLNELLTYLGDNKALFDTRIERAAPGIRSMRLQSTYLAWVDFSGTGLPTKDIHDRIGTRARIFASPGPQFGAGGDTWMRFNLATPQPVLLDALNRLDAAFADLR
jgi:cysteine-S-conjugate beta-lyase